MLKTQDGDDTAGGAENRRTESWDKEGSAVNQYGKYLMTAVSGGMAAVILFPAILGSAAVFPPAGGSGTGGTGYYTESIPVREESFFGTETENSSGRDGEEPVSGISREASASGQDQEKSEYGQDDEMPGGNTETANAGTDPAHPYSSLRDAGGAEIAFEDGSIKSAVQQLVGLNAGDAVTEGMCAGITELDLTEESLTTLADLEYFPNLRVLKVENNGNPLNLKGINQPKDLQALTLRNCALSEVDRIAELGGLTYLDISDSGYGTDVNDYSSLSALKNLKTLNMGWTGYNAYNGYSLTDASFINGLTSLEELNLWETGVENYDLSALSSLKKLTISECDADEILRQLCASGAIRQLEYLHIRNTLESLYSFREISDEGQSRYLSQAENLRYLDIDIGELTSMSGFTGLKRLEYLYLDNDLAFGLPCSAYQALSQLGSVSELVMEAPPNICEKVHDGTITPDDYSFLSGMCSLRKADLRAYDGMSISSFSSLPQLEMLALWDTNMFAQSEVDIAEIGNLPSLKTLQHHGIRFKSSAPLDELGYLTVEDYPLYG